MIRFLYLFLMCLLFACGGGTMYPEEVIYDSAQNKEKEKGNSLITGFLKSDKDKGIFDSDPSIKQGGISYLLIKYGNTGIVNVKISISSNESVNDIDKDFSSMEPMSQNQLLENKYCIAKLSDFNCIKELDITDDDKKNGYKIDEFTTNEAYPGYPVFFGLYTFNEENQNEWTLLAELHTYCYFEDPYHITIFNVGKSFLKKEFSEMQDKTYGRAAVNVTTVEKNFDLLTYENESNISYLNVRAVGDDYCYQNHKDDISFIEDDIRSNPNSYASYDNRVIFSLGVGTRLYWTFEETINGEYSVCSSNIWITPFDLPENTIYYIGSIYSINDDCPSEKKVQVQRRGFNWMFNEGNGWVEGYFSDYVKNARCDVLIQENTPNLNNQKLEAHLNGGVAITKGIPNDEGSYRAFYTLLPYSNDPRPAIHEIGHLLGLVDVNDDFLGFGTEEQNIMHKNELSSGTLLRGRPMKYKDNEQKKEYQWDCLHRIHNSSCVDEDLHKFENTNYLIKEQNYEFR